MNLCKHYISINYILIKNLAWTLWPVLKLAQGKHENTQAAALAALHCSASKRSIRRFVITEKAPTRAFSWLKAPTSAFTIKTLLRHYAK